MFWLLLFATLFLSNMLGISIGFVIVQKVKHWGKEPVKIVLPLDAGKLIAAEDLDEYIEVHRPKGDGGAVFIPDPDAEEYDEHQLKQRPAWGIIDGLKNILKSVKGDK